MRFDYLSYPTTDHLNEPIELLELGTDKATVHPLHSTIYNTGVLLLSIHSCSFTLGAQLRTSTVIKKDGEYYRYDPRLTLLNNEIDSPMELESTSVDETMRTCPLLDISAPKTNLNEHGCTVLYGCRPNDYSSNSFELNETTIRAFFTSGNNYVYAVDSLPLPTSSDPCTQSVRWRTISSCEGRATASLDNGTITVLANAIRTSLDTNRFVKDVRLSNGDKASCKNAKGSVIDVDGECWQHVHDDILNVYDFSLWAKAHDGNVLSAGFTPVAKAAREGRALLSYPRSHPLSRWDANSGGSWTAIGAPIGRHGDRLTFYDLPRRLQSAGFAKAVGVSVSAAAGVPGEEMCGSPGESANDPTLGQRFYFGKERYSQVGAYTQQEVLKNFETLQDKKMAIHTMSALRAPDQLRQRVAWALSQACVVGEFSSAVLSDHAEVWTAFYDIFVRHAFGNYREVLREISFSPLMAMYLTFLNSDSIAFSGSVPDEVSGLQVQ
jgi:cullin-associated NEDD8-dissociated protein 1